MCSDNSNTKTPHSRIIEMYAINNLEFCIGKELVLESKIPRNDTEPSWDGEIHMYKNEKHNAIQEGVTRIPVQVKGKFKPEWIKRPNITYPVRIGDLRNYASERGCVYFVIVVSEEETEYSIFYNMMTPVKINKYLLEKQDKTGDKTIGIRFNKLNHRRKGELTKILLQYNFEWKKQISKKAKKMEEISNKSELKCTAIGVTSVQEFLETYNRGDIGLYTISMDGIEIPIEWDEETKMYETSIVDAPVLVNGKRFYDTYVQNRDEQGIESIDITPSISFCMRDKKLIFKPNADLFSIKKDFDFLNEMLVKRSEIAFTDSFKTTYKEKVPKDFMREKNQIDLLYEIFQRIDVNIKTPYTKLSEDDWQAISFLIDIYTGKNTDVFEDNRIIYNIPLDGHNIVIFMIRDDVTGKVNFINVFRKNEYDVHIVDSYDNHYKMPMFALEEIDRKIISRLYDNDYENMVEIVQDLDFEGYIYSHLDRILLEMIAAYDMNKNKVLLKATEKIAEILLNHYDTYVYAVVNYLQVKKRSTELTKEDKKILFDIKKSAEDKFMICTVDILLDNEYEVFEIYDNFDDAEKEVFKTLPIVNIYSGSLE